jgi:hypothetical protein
MYVAVIYLEACNNQARPLTSESSFLGLADIGRDEKKVLR